MSDDVPPNPANPSGVGRPKRATIYDIAEMTGFNPSTVSRALSRGDRVSAKTRERILEAAAALDFQINPIARALPTGLMRTIGFVVADITNPMVFGLIRGATLAAARGGFTLVITESQESGQTEAAAIEQILPSVDGVVLATTRLSDEQIAGIARRKPLILVNRVVGDLPHVVAEVSRGAAEVVDHLADLGHRSLAYLAGPTTSWMSRQRWEALLTRAEARGVSIVEIGPNLPTATGGADTFRRLIASSATAAVAFNDLMALGIVRRGREVGVDIPKELSIVGFDDIFGADLISPPLTTVRSPLNDIGDHAVRRLLVALGVRETQDDDAVELPTSLVVRESTAAPRPVARG